MTSTQTRFPGANRGPLRLGTRRSRLATTQSEGVADLLRAHGHEVQIVPIVTEGDLSAAPLTQIGGNGVFASAIRQALHEDRIDLAVHSLKDLPVAPEPGLVIAAIPVRVDPRDALCARDGLTLEALPAGARVGTGSPRRVAQLRTRRPDLDIVPLRGNVETRLKTVTHGRLDAILLAYAGLTRLGLRAHVTQVLEATTMLPAPGQGALAVECRADRPEIVEALGAVDDA
ncbi:MAG: hydroxymethylbilane synthase, partial [Micrococcales bacterium]|nr:hydroxymethylbilane synthase [Micrococcales bacterium]